MGEVFDTLRFKYPEYDHIPDQELAGLVLDKFPEYGKTDITEVAKRQLNPYPQQGTLTRWWQNLKTAGQNVSDSLSSNIREGSKELYRDVKDVATTPPELVKPQMVDEGGNITGGGLLSQSPMGIALNIASKEGRLAGIAELSKWMLPGSIGSRGSRAVSLGAIEKPIQSETRVPSLYEQGRAARSVGQAEYGNRQVKRPSNVPGPYDLTPEQSSQRMPKAEPFNELMPTAQEIASKRAPLTAEESTYALPAQQHGLVTQYGQEIGNIGTPVEHLGPTPSSLGPQGTVIAKNLWSHRGSIDPYTAFAAARVAAGATAGAMSQDNGVDSLRYGIALGALGGLLGPKAAQLVHGATAMWKPSPLLADSTNFGVWAAKTKAQLGQFFLPSEIVRGIAPAENIVREANAATTIQRQIEDGLMHTLKTIYASLHGDIGAIQRIHRVLDGQTNIPLSPAEAVIAQRIRTAFDDMADRAGLPRQSRLADYFPHLRDEISSELHITIGSDTNIPITKNIPQDYRPFYEKARTLPTDSTVDFGMNSVLAYAKGAAKRIAMKGGTDLEGEAVPGFLNRIPEHFAALPEVPALKAYMAQYARDLVHGAEQVKYGILTREQATTIKAVEFLRTIGMNAMSPVTNTLQQLLTLAHVDTRSFFAAYYHMLTNPEMLALAKRSGVVTADFSKADLHALTNPTGLQKYLDKAVSTGGYVFGRAEYLNRFHAFTAGYLDAQRTGLTGRDAMEYATNIVNKSQFRFGAENLAPWMRGGSPELSLVAQYKSFSMNYASALKDLALHNPVGAMKYVIGATALGGTDMLTGSDLGHVLRKHIADMLGGDPKDYKFRGVLGEMGVYLGQQLALGALPAENVSSLFFFLPGPAVSHIMDAASVVLGRDLNVTALGTGAWGKKLSAEQMASKVTSGVNVQANRVRQAMVLRETGDPNTRVPRTVPEAFGLGDPSGKAGRPVEYGEALRKFGGVPSQAVYEATTAQHRAGQQIQEYKDLVSQAALARRAGDIEEFKRLNQLSVQQYGRGLVVGLNAMKRAAEQTSKPSLERTIRHAPKPIRPYIRQESQD